MKNLDQPLFINELEKRLRVIIRQEIKNSGDRFLLDVEKTIREEVMRCVGNRKQNIYMEIESAPGMIKEKKIEILTNEGIKPISKLSYLEENKHKFYIWVDGRKPELRINNKVQEKMANAIQSINLLVMLLEKHDNLVSHEEIFNALDRKGRKCNSSTIRVSRKKYRPNVVKMINNLHKKTNRRLKQHICSVPSCGYRFDLKNIKFCIIYKKIMNKNYADI